MSSLAVIFLYCAISYPNVNWRASEHRQLCVKFMQKCAEETPLGTEMCIPKWEKEKGNVK